MKAFKILLIAVVVVSLGLNSCKSAPKFSNVTGIEWLLVEVQTKPNNIKFSRETLQSEGFNNIFTLNFDAERLNGVGAPNRYAAPYKVDKDQVISVSLIAGTLMTPIYEPEKLKEQEYFAYLQNAYKWNLFKKDRFELYSKNADGDEVVLIYKLGTVYKGK